MYIQLTDIKKHLNLEDAYTADDAYLEFLEGVAVEIVEKHIDNTLDDIASDEGVIPQPLLHCILLFIGNLYDNRESVSYTNVTEVPKSLDYILSMYRNYKDANI